MSREFKFRVWLKPTYEHKCEFMDRYGKKLPDLECRLYTQDVFFDDTWLDTEDYEDIIVEQYTGLKDKNGKEIYEGDIMRFDAIDYEIYWSSDFSGWHNRRTDKSERIYGSNSFEEVTRFGSVIGNIHENKELLGGKE